MSDSTRTDEQEPSVQTLAKYAVQWFETAYRDDCDANDEPYYRLTDGRPEWVQDLVYEAHGDFGPEDWRYKCIASALEWIADNDEDAEDAGEFADQYVDVYTGRRLAWLASNLNRPLYCQEAFAEIGNPETAGDVVELAGLGQYWEASEVYGLVYRQLEARLETVTA